MVGGGNFKAVGLVVVAVLGLGIGLVLVVPNAAVDVDTSGMVAGCTSMLVGAVAAWLAWVMVVQADGDAAATADRLAHQVMGQETRALRQLLGGDAAAIDVRFVLRRTRAHNADGALPDGTLGEVADYYLKLKPGRLVITGAPGSGKTVTAIGLLVALLERRGPGDPVPVRLSLSAWSELTAGSESAATAFTPAPELMTKWLVRTLRRTYGLRAGAATALVNAGKVVPFLDGLDEMDGANPAVMPAQARGVRYRSRARRALEVLNAFQQGAHRAPLVVTCRNRAYRDLEALDVWARDAARVKLTRVSVAQARDYVNRRARDPERWRAVLDHIAAAPSGVLARGLSTPWRLSIAVDAHERRHPATGAYLNTPRDLLAPGLGNPDALRDHLIRLLITSTVVAHPLPGRPDAARVRAWLGTLAAYLDGNAATARTVAGRALSGSDLVPLELWPLAGVRRVRAVHRLVAAACLIPALVVVHGSQYGYGPLDPVAVVPFALVLAYLVARRKWPTPYVFGGRVGHDAARRQHLATSSGLGAMVGGGVGGAVGIVANTLYWPVFGLVGGLALGLVAGLATSGDAETRMVLPQDAVRANIRFGIAAAVILGLVVGGLDVLRDRPPAVMIAAGTAAGILCGLFFAGATVNYFVLVLCTRKNPPLPWRLGRFLHWANGTALLRTAGNAYQFRHKELQDWLADPTQQI